MAYALYFPHRQILLFLLFPVLVARVRRDRGRGEPLFGHDGHQRAASRTSRTSAAWRSGYLYLKSKTPRFHPIAEIKYRYLKWKINRVKRKFDVYSGGRADDVNRRIH